MDKKRTDIDGQQTFAFKYRNEDLERIVGTQSLRDFIHVRYLKYIARNIAHICRRPNSHLTKQLLFIQPTAV
jgi:hypothetical protein